MRDGETDALLVPASLLASWSCRSAPGRIPVSTPPQRRHLKFAIWKRAAACWPHGWSELYKFGSEGLCPAKIDDTKKLIGAGLFCHRDSGHTPHEDMSTCKFYQNPKIHRKTRGLFELTNHARDLSALCRLVWAPLSEWQAGGTWMQTKFAWKRLQVYQRHNALHPPCRCQAASRGAGGPPGAILIWWNASFVCTCPLPPSAYRKNGEHRCWSGLARSLKGPSRKGCRRTTRPETHRRCYGARILLHASIACFVWQAFKRYGPRLAEWPGFAQILLEAGFHCVWSECGTVTLLSELLRN